MRAIRLVLVVSIAMIAAADGAKAHNPATPTAAAALVNPADSLEPFQGFLVPASSTDVSVPDFFFRISGWDQSSGYQKLVELAPDGQKVKAGDVIARFDFSAPDILKWIGERIQSAKAQDSENRVAREHDVEALLAEKRRKEIEWELAGINVKRAPAVSRIQADTYRIASRLAEFEIGAASERITALRHAVEAERSYFDAFVQRYEADLERFHYYQESFRLLAPHDGVVRHAINHRFGRKMQQGDGLNSGNTVVSVARDATLAVRFFVPEQRLQLFLERPQGQTANAAMGLAIGSQVTVVTPASGEEFTAVVKHIDFFPTNLGFLRENYEFADAFEKAFEVRAELRTALPTLTAGTEVRVKLKQR